MPSFFVMFKGDTKPKARFFTNDRDIVCLPSCSVDSHVISIPRNREKLCEDGLVGRIRLTSEMSEEDIFALQWVRKRIFNLKFFRVLVEKRRHWYVQHYPVHTSGPQGH